MAVTQTGYETEPKLNFFTNWWQSNYEVLITFTTIENLISHSEEERRLSHSEAVIKDSDQNVYGGEGQEITILLNHTRRGSYPLNAPNCAHSASPPQSLMKHNIMLPEVSINCQSSGRLHYVYSAKHSFAILLLPLVFGLRPGREFCQYLTLY